MAAFGRVVAIARAETDREKAEGEATLKLNPWGFPPLLRTATLRHRRPNAREAAPAQLRAARLASDTCTARGRASGPLLDAPRPPEGEAAGG